MLGKTVDKFRIDAILGEGGMGAVYRAWDTVLERPVALKMIHRQYTVTGITFKRFLSEAKIVAKLDHPNIVPVHDLLEHEGSWFIVMQYIEGMTLTKLIEHDGPMPHQRFSPICKGILSALGYAHDAGVIHRDVKPSNVIIAFEGTAKITDFGLAKSEHIPSFTKSSSTAGTLYYMSPEHVKNFAAVDHRSDLYAAGMTMYEMLTGRTPFSSASAPVDILNAILQEQFPPPSRVLESVPEPLSEIVMKALAKDPAKRYQSAHEMLSAIAQFENRIAYAKTVSLPAENVYDAFGRDFSRQAVHEEIRQARASYGPPATSLRPRPGKFKRALLGLLGITTAALLVLFAFEMRGRSFETPASPPDPDGPFLPVRLSIFTEPANATVFLNGDSIGLTPLTSYSVKPGKHALRIQKHNYLPVVSTAAIAADEDTIFNFILAGIEAPSPKASTAASDSVEQTLHRRIEVGAVWIDSSPRGVMIIFDDQSRGSTPRTIKNVGMGNHRIVLRKAGYRDTSISVAIEGGETQNINATLLPFMGALRFMVNPSGAVFIDGVQKRHNASDAYETNLQVGSHRIRIENPALGVFEKTMDIEADRVHDLIVDFTRMLKLIVTAFDTAGQPVRAEVIVDGKRIGQTLQELDVRLGLHMIEVRRESYVLIGNPQEIQLEENTAQPVRMRFTLGKMQ